MHKITVMKYSNGRYGLFGSGIPSHLAYVQANGEALTEHQKEVIVHCGAGLLGRKIKGVVFESEEAANKALNEALEKL
jgi:hypothetical protein